MGNSSSAYSSRMGGGGDRSFSFGAETPRTPRESSNVAASLGDWRLQSSGHAAAAAATAAFAQPGDGDRRGAGRAGFVVPSADGGGGAGAVGGRIDFSTPAPSTRRLAPEAGDMVGLFDGLGEEDLSFGTSGGSPFGGGNSGVGGGGGGSASDLHRG